MYQPNLKSVALPIPEIIAIKVLGGGCEPQCRGKGDRRGSGDGTVRKSVGEFSMVAFPLSLRISEILPLLCPTTPLFPTPQSPLLVSPKFLLPHVPLGAGGWSLGNEERRYWVNCPCN